MDQPSQDRDAAFVALLTEHQLAIRHYVASLLPGESSAPDVAQQANMTIWKKREDFELGTNFKAWVFSIARYEVLNFRRQKAKDERFLFNEELIELMAEEMPELGNDFGARQQALQHCLGKLRPVDRDLVIQRYFKAGSMQDYAEEVGRSVGALRVTLHRIRNGLQHCISQQLAAKGGQA